MTLSAIGTLAEMNFALGIQMAECDAKLETLSKISWKISDYFDRKEKHEDLVATMRYSIHMMNRELDLIDSFTEKKSCCQFTIMAWRPHDNCYVFFFDSNF